jgi:hypothetical protein
MKMLADYGGCQCRRDLLSARLAGCDRTDTLTLTGKLIAARLRAGRCPASWARAMLAAS